jgi:ATP-binding cassette subfamily B protein
LFLTTLNEFLSVTPRLVSLPCAQQIPRPIKSGVLFDNVTFRYPQESRVAIEGVSFAIKPGEHIAFVGANGAGKTTLVKLLCRLYEPASGRIMVDGTDLAGFEVEDLRGAISVILQDFVKYQMTVRENIGLGIRVAEPDLQRIITAAKQAGIHEVVSQLPQGYETVLGKWFTAGCELSAGEWQKVALARAFLRDSQILILDEPTSAMDAKAEAELFSRFHELARGRSAILISHRLSTVKMVDRIYVLDQGRILESGTHDELMHRDGVYAELFRTQAQYYQ